MSFHTKALIFDLGNVIILFSFDNAFRRWAELSGKSYKYIISHFAFDTVHEDFEKGLVSPDDFYRHVNNRLGNILNFDQFTEGWNSIYNGLVPESDSLLKALSKRYSLYALTNTNSVHFPFCGRIFRDVFSLFDKIYPSHDLGLRKPDPDIFRAVLNDRNLKPEEAVFFDDLEENIAGARKAGIPSKIISSPEQLKECVESALS